MAKRADPVTFGPMLGRFPASVLKRFERRFGHPPAEIPVGFSVLAVYVHKDNPYRGGLSMEDVDTIFSSESWEARWGDLGCGGEWFERPIVLHAPKGRDPRVILEQHRRYFWFKDSVRFSNDASVIAAVADDPGGMGLASVESRTDKVRALELAPKGSRKFVPGTAENVWNGSYPLAAPLYLWVTYDPHAGFELDPPRREFLRYILSREGQEAVVKAGYVPLSAELAERALALVHLAPSGAGSWDMMMKRLRARRVPARQLDSIERLVRRIGDQPGHEQLADLAAALARTGLTSSVAFATAEEGATIKYHPIGDPKATGVARTTEEVTLPIGLYHVWTERDGKPTSRPEAWFQIVRDRERIRIWEGR